MNEFTLPAWLRWLLVSGLAAIAAVPLSFVIWRAPSGAVAPPSSLLPYFVAIAVVIPALAFGFGVAFLLLGRKLVHLERAPRLSRAAFLGIGWLLVNWWPHSNFHRVASGWTEIALVDYFFHTTVIIATCVVAAFYLKIVSERQATARVEAEARVRASAPA